MEENNFINNQRGNFQIILGVLALLFVVSGGAYYLGARNNNSISNNTLTTNSQNILEPTTSIQTTPSANPAANINQPAQKSSSSSKPVAIPSGWKSFTATDPDFGVKTTMSMPPGYSFGFTGSEFTIQKDFDATELWDYSTSVYRDNNGILKNHYEGSSRRAWYEKRLFERQSTDKIISVNEKPLGASTYLEITVQAPSYNDRGVTSGTKSGKHYIFVQNNILHMITPASNKAYTSDAQIPANIELILASLSSSQTK